MKTLELAAFVALAKQLGYTGSTSFADVEAMRKHIVGTGRVVNDETGPINFADLKVLDDAPLVIKTGNAAPIEPKSAPANPTSDLDTIVKNAVSKALEGAINRPNFNAAASGEMTVVDGDERMFKATKRHFSDYDQAKKFRHYLITGVLGKTAEYANSPLVKREQKRAEGDRVLKAYTSSTQAGGGATTFMEFNPDLIANLNTFGAARKLAKVTQMNEEQMFVPVRTGIHTLYYPQQASTVTQSTGVTYSNVQLSVKTGICIVKVSKQLIQDSNIGFVDDQFGEIARCIAFTEDTEMFTAAGEATYANIRGLANRFTGGGYTGAGTWTAISHAAGSVAGGTDAKSHTITNIVQAIGKVPTYARPGMVIACTPQITDLVFRRLSLAQGGVTMKETLEYGTIPMFQGIPIIENNVMNDQDVAASNTVDFYIGNFQRGILLGDRMGVELDANEYIYWDSHCVGLKGSIRHDINVHDIGDATTSQSGTGRVGPIVALYQT